MIITLKVTGMKCTGCENHAKEELFKVKGVKEVKVDRSNNQIEVVAADDVLKANLISAINDNTHFHAE